MNTAAIAGSLADAAADFRDLLGEVTAADLLRYLKAELGDAEILDGFRPHGAALAQAFGPRTILHVISGNTPHAGLQSLLRGLLLGAHNLCKLPSGGLPVLADFHAALQPPLDGRVEFSEQLPDDWIARADAVIVFGSDATIAAMRARARPDQRFIAHGHRVSLGLILDDPEFASVEAAARAVSLFDQQGCLSPQGFYVAGNDRAYAEKLAAAMARQESASPRGQLTVSEAAGFRAWCEDFQFRAANDPERLAVWKGPSWTVAYDAADPVFTPSPLYRTVIVKPLPADLPAALANVRPHLSTIALWPAHASAAVVARDLGASRLCGLDALQFPPLTWHQDGAPSLSSLVRWIDLEVEPG